MARIDNPIRVDGEQQLVKQCCASLYESDLARFLLGDSFHPGGLQLTVQLGHMLGLNPTSLVLDVACGKGTTAIFIAKEFGCEVVGIDYGEQNVEAARSLTRTEHLESRVRFERSDAESLAFSDESFDVIICECAFCTFPNKASAAKEFFRVLRRGGQVGISDLTRQEALPKELNGLLAWITCIGDAQTIEGYSTFLRGAGFSVGSIKERNDALEQMTNQVRLKLLGVEIMTGLNKLQLPVLDLGAAKRMANSAMAVVKQGQLGYALICGKKPDWHAGDGDTYGCMLEIYGDVSNAGRTDRALRILLGIDLGIACILVHGHPYLALALGIAGASVILTGTCGIWLAYRVLGWTQGKAKSSWDPSGKGRMSEKTPTR